MEEASPGIIMNEQASLLHMLICFGKYGVEYRFIDLKRKRWHLLHCLLHVIHAAKKKKRNSQIATKNNNNNNVNEFDRYNHTFIVIETQAPLQTSRAPKRFKVMLQSQ